MSKEKIYLSELEKEKVNNLNASKENLNKIYARVGELKTNLTAVENEALQSFFNTSKAEQDLVNSLTEKYGDFQLGEGFEVIIKEKQ